MRTNMPSRAFSATPVLAFYGRGRNLWVKLRVGSCVHSPAITMRGDAMISRMILRAAMRAATTATFAMATAVVLTAAIPAATHAQTQAQPSLGDLARQQRAANAAAKSQNVITNDGAASLSSVPGIGVDSLGGPSASALPSDAQSATDSIARWELVIRKISELDRATLV